MTSARQRSLIGLGGALGLHGVLLAVLFLVNPAPPEVNAMRPPVRIRVLDRPSPPAKPPEPPNQPEPAKAPVEVKKPEPKPVAKAAPEKKVQKKKPKPRKRPPKARVAKAEPPPAAAPKTPPPPEPPAAKPAEPAAEEAPRRARKFTVAMEATVPGGGVAVPTSAGQGWAYGAPDGDPDGARIPGGSTAGDAAGVDDRPAPSGPRQAAEVSRLPRFLGGPSADEMRAAYPAEARREGREADVRLKILVSAAGRVERVRLLRSAGEEFDAVALSLVKRFRFSPGEEGGRAVAVWIPWTYKFRLEG